MPKWWNNFPLWRTLYNGSNKMANISITKGTRKNGVSYTARVRQKQSGIITFSKSKTFNTKSAANKWAKETAHKVENNIKDEPYSYIDISLGELIQNYIKAKDGSDKPLGRTARYSLNQLCRYPIAKVIASRLNSNDIVDFCLERRKKTASQTISIDVSCLRKVLRVAKSMFHVAADDSAVINAYPALHDLKLIDKSNKRDRRVSADEYSALLREFQKMSYHHCNEIPYTDMFMMSLLTCCRIGELCELKWKDLNVEQRHILVRNRKSPSGSQNNNSILPLLGESLSIVLEQPKFEERIFPYNPRSVTAGFRRARKRLGIVDLRYHDLRREGASRLIEAGMSVEETSRITGHKDLNILWNVYVSITPEHIQRRFEKLKMLT